MATTITVTTTSSTENNERQSFRMTMKTTKYMLHFVLQEKKGRNYMFLVLISALFNTIPTIIYTIFPGMIINQLTGEFQRHILYTYVGILLLTPIFYQIFNRFISKKKIAISQQLSAVFTRKYNYHTAMMDYEVLEKPDIQDKSNRVFGTFQGAVQIIDKMGNLVSAVLGLIAILSIIATINIFIIFVVLIVIFINTGVSKHVNQNNFLNNKEVSRFDRYIGNLSIVLNFINYAKEVRLYNLKSHFSEMLYQKRTEKNEINLKSITNDLNSQILFSLTNFLQQAVLYIYLIYRVIHTGLPIGSMTIYMSAVNQFTGAFNSIANGYMAL